MLKRDQGSLSWLQFDLFSKVPGLVHGVFSRRGGVSAHPFDSLNAASSVGDCAECVRENLSKIRQALGLSRLSLLRQVHSADVVLVEAEPHREAPSCDGQISLQKGIGLTILHADCQAALFFDPIHRAIAAVHAGWRGQVQDIYGACVRKMAASFGSRAEDLLVGISPSLGPTHAEFRHFQQEFPQEFWPFREGDCHFNLWDIARYQLERSGVLPHHIEIARLCTFSEEEEYFSYRRSRVTGRNATLIGFVT